MIIKIGLKKILSVKKLIIFHLQKALTEFKKNKQHYKSRLLGLLIPLQKDIEVLQLQVYGKLPKLTCC